MKSTKELARELGFLRRRSNSGTKKQQRSGNITCECPSFVPVKSGESYLPQNVRNGQPFHYLVVIDFESTCWKGERNRTQEIIEFPAVLMNTSSGRCEDEFHFYLQPSEQPVLSDFCKELTGITQAQVEDGIPLSLCMKKFSHWIEKLQKEKNILFNPVSTHPVKGTFLTWSDWDLGVCLQYECKRKQILKPAYLNSWVDLRATYRSFYGRKPHGLNGALQDVGIKFSGREHSGVDDARNTARLAWRMICDGCVLKITKTMKGLNFTVERPIQNHQQKLPAKTNRNQTLVKGQVQTVADSAIVCTDKQGFKRPFPSCASTKIFNSDQILSSPGKKHLKRSGDMKGIKNSKKNQTKIVTGERESGGTFYAEQGGIKINNSNSRSNESLCKKSGLQFNSPKPSTSRQITKFLCNKVPHEDNKENISPAQSSKPTGDIGNFKTPGHLLQSVCVITGPPPGMVTPVSGQRRRAPPFVSVTPPLCQCGKRSKRRFVQTPGPNQGRCFYSCPIGRSHTVESDKKTGCQFFQWEKGLSRGVNQFAPAMSRNAMSTGQLRRPMARTLHPDNVKLTASTDFHLTRTTNTYNNKLKPAQLR